MAISKEDRKEADRLWEKGCKMISDAGKIKSGLACGYYCDIKALEAEGFENLSKAQNIRGIGT